MAIEQINVELCDHWGTDRNAAEAAWASSYSKEKAEARSDEDVIRVVTGLVNHHHDTPKERVWMELFLTCPIYVERQFDKYRMTVQYQQFDVEFFVGPMGRDNITQNELSGRYRTIPNRVYTMPDDVATVMGKAVFYAERNLRSQWLRDAEEAADWFTTVWNDRVRQQHENYELSLKTLREAEQGGVITNAEYKRARESLRGELGTAYLTDMRIVMNLNAFEHIVNQRIPKEAQVESRVAALLMLNEAVKGEVAPEMVKQMAEANGWYNQARDLLKIEGVAEAVQSRLVLSL